MIDRREWVTRHDPVLQAADPASPLTVGNGSMAFNVDVTGLQTLYEEYTAETPLCTMANWGWHITPAENGQGYYTHQDLVMERYDFCGREVRYAQHKQPGNEHVYDWLRKNPHKFDLARIRLSLGGEAIRSSVLRDIHQQLHLYEGWIESNFNLQRTPCRVITACDRDTDTLALRVESALLQDGLALEIALPYPDPGIAGADWQADERHSTILTDDTIQTQADDCRYEIRIRGEGIALRQTGKHRICVTTDAAVMEVAVSMSAARAPQVDFVTALERCKAGWRHFWEKGGAIDLGGAEDPRAQELERRIVLSLYLMAINSSGSVPPAETGLTCNSWFGKAHLEMHFWHMAWAPLWGHGELLERSLPWYHDHLAQARDNAARNGYRGVRWQKMVGENGVDSPSNIAVLLIWQQPHIITMLELLRREKQSDEEKMSLMRRHWDLVRETADFMADYAVLDEQDGLYHIEPPVIPVQERHKAEVTRDPSFEVAYWKYGLGLAIQWAKMLGEAIPEAWVQVHQHMTPPPVQDGIYIAHANCPETFETTTIDHPSMLQCYGVLPRQDVDAQAMAQTLQLVTERWDYVSLWGWDFAVMAMTAVRLGQPELALDQLLCVSHKNTYVCSGNNRQISRRDLPLYLPGNGSLLLATAMMAAGWDGSGDTPGFGCDGWKVRWEGIHPYI